MHIEVQQDHYYYPLYLSVKIDGFCNHRGERDVHEIETEQGYNRTVITCSDCDAEYNELDDRFYNEK